MALETGVTYIEDLVDTNPVGATDNVSEGDDHIRNIKTAVQGSFPSLGAAAVTSTAAELNILDGVTSTTAELNILDGVTRTTSEINQLEQVVQATAQASTSGSTIDFTSLPTWVKKITVVFAAVSTSGASITGIRIGDSGGFEATGYDYAYFTGRATPSINSSTAGTENRICTTNGFAGTISGTVTISNVDGNVWCFSSTIAETASTPTVFTGSGVKTLTATMDRVQVVLASGTFDAGTINILYEG